MSPKDNRREKLRQLRHASLLIAIPMLMLASPLIGYGIGVLLDSILNTSPWLRIIFLFIGLGAGMHQTFVLIKRVASDNK
jgi:F0F1-type ATP synthase assembly protein I